MKQCEHDGRITAYRESVSRTEGPCILYVHGSGGSHRLWAGQYGASGPPTPAVAVDLSGHGASDDVDTEPGPETLAVYASDVVAVARETGARVLVGNSLGGAVILQILLEKRLDPDAAVLVGSGAKLAVAEPLRAWLANDFERAIEFLHGPDRLFHNPDDRTVATSKTAMRESGRAVTERDFLSCHTFDVRERLGDIEIPTLAVTGEYDRLTPPAYHEFLAEALPVGRQRIIPEAAHLAMVERPSVFNDIHSTFVDDVVVKSSD